ncbi:hypothetical protein [Phascolarctobacterium succinatutens]|uniref:hypothetical protein n=1 Tax=Phascolarctobacterium succinatutens TaxID=626940 RepID=UPI0023F82877|nr:hypothetical protein [Phascolarctobacterium succinatutens]
MIFDQQNMYMDNSLTSNVIANVGGGDAADPLFLVITAPTALTGSGTITAALETSDSENFSAKTVVATYTLAASKKGILVAAKLPYGMKAFSRLTVTGASSGKLTAGLTETVPNWPG